ncbi:hypothetical protein [Campylobacter phage CJLB-14]|nr:hypothetical protein [Campylobacter phage CJLB-14]
MVKASGVAIVPDGIEFSEETNEFWDEITNKFLEVLNSNIDILVNDGGMKKHEAIVQVLEDVKMLYRND